MILLATLLGVILVLCASALYYYMRRPYLAMVDDLDTSTRTSSSGEEKEVVIITYSSKNGKYGRICLPKSSMEKHLPELKVGDMILKYRGSAIPKLARRMDVQEKN